MNQELTKKYFNLLNAWNSGLKLYTYRPHEKKWVKIETIYFDTLDDMSEPIIIADIHFEARKAHALGEKIEIKDGNGYWVVSGYPLFSSTSAYRVKKKEWFETLDEKPVLCWLWNSNLDTKIISLVRRYRIGMEYKFETECNTPSKTYRNAEPVAPKDCWGYNDK